MKSFFYLLTLLCLVSCEPHAQKINLKDIKGNWQLSQAIMFTSLEVGDSSVLVRNRADTIFTVRYSISHDTLITYAPFANRQFKNKIILLTKDTLVLDGIMDVKEERHYSRSSIHHRRGDSIDSNPNKTTVSKVKEPVSSDSLKKIRFWNSVVVPILNHDKATVLSNMDFPVYGHWTQMMELDKKSHEATREDFANIYDHFFNHDFIEELNKMRPSEVNVSYRESSRDTLFSFYIGKKLGLGEGGLSLVYVKEGDMYKLKGVQGAGGNFYYNEFAKPKH